MEPRICVFKVTVVSADNVWNAEVGTEGPSAAKAAVSVHFPGQEDGSHFQSDAVLPSPPTAESAITNRTSTPEAPSLDSIKNISESPDKGPKTKKEKGRTDENPNSISPSAVVSPSPRREAFLNFSEGLETGASKRVHTLAHLRQLADEYEADGDYLSANKCYEESVSEDRMNPDIWLEYGLFGMRGKQKDHGKAEECFREAINLRQDHVLSLLALACLLWHRSFSLQSEVLLNKIVELHSQEEVIAWVLLGQIHLSAGDQVEEAISCFRRAESLHTTWKDTRSSSSHELTSSVLKHPFSLSNSILQYHIPNNPYVDTALLLLDLHLPREAQEVLNVEHADFSCDIEYKLCLARVQEMIGDYNEAEKLIKETIIPCDTHAVAWMLLGHLYYSTSSLQQAIYAYEKMLRYGGEKPLFVLGFLELGKSYLHEHHLDKAKKIFLEVCSSNPSSSSWLGAGMVFYEEGDMKHAEAALVEGNVLDPWNFKIWAYLALISLKTNRMEEAEFAFDQALQSNAFWPLLVEMAEAFYDKGNTRAAETALQKACEEKDEGLISRLSWGTVSWQEKVCLVKRVLENMENKPDIKEFSFEFDPVKAISDHHHPGLQSAPSLEYPSDAQLKELEALSSL